MARIVVTDTSGEQRELELKTGQSLMQLITDAGFSDLLALCGGVCSCATCHVYVDPDFFGKLPGRSEDEQELLEASDHYRDNSRLSCQVLLDDSLDGMPVTIAPAD